MSLHAECDRIGKSDDKGRHLHYGAELPPDAAEMQRLIATLGVSMPSTRDWPQGQLAAYYLQALFALGVHKPPDAARDAARKVLVHRLLSLPASAGMDTVHYEKQLKK
jgi:hypothetical protein